jgi:hypothetical protein
MKKCFVFDFDQTLADTTARIKVMSNYSSTCPENDEFVGYLTPSQFSSYSLDLGEYFDFSEFRDDKFIHNADPTFLMHLAKEVSEEDQDVYILTAREDDSADAIQEFLLQYGVKAKTIHCVGGIQSTIPHKKREMLLTVMQDYDKVYYFDDCPNNIKHAPEGENIRKYKV